MIDSELQCGGKRNERHRDDAETCDEHHATREASIEQYADDRREEVARANEHRQQLLLVGEARQLEYSRRIEHDGIDAGQRERDGEHDADHQRRQMTLREQPCPATDLVPLFGIDRRRMCAEIAIRRARQQWRSLANRRRSSAGAGAIGRRAVSFAQPNRRLWREQCRDKQQRRKHYSQNVQRFVVLIQPQTRDVY